MDSKILEELRAETAGEDLDLSWLDQPAAERGLRVAPGKRRPDARRHRHEVVRRHPRRRPTTRAAACAAPRRAQRPAAHRKRTGTTKSAVWSDIGDAALRRGGAAAVE